jgi:hypothetical protein
MASELLADEIVTNGTIDADLTKEIAIGDSTVTLSVKKA